jgi:hypothetical protein
VDSMLAATRRSPEPVSDADQPPRPLDAELIVADFNRHGVRNVARPQPSART